LPKAQFAAHHHLASQLDPLPDISAEFEADVADLIDIVRRAGRQPRRTVLGIFRDLVAHTQRHVRAKPLRMPRYPRSMSDASELAYGMQALGRAWPMSFEGVRSGSSGDRPQRDAHDDDVVGVTEDGYEIGD
jgi:hypothetical protein